MVLVRIICGLFILMVVLSDMVLPQCQSAIRLDVSGRDIGENQINLRCRWCGNFSNVQDPRLFVNSTNTPVQFKRGENGMLEYNISQELEGYYYCGASPNNIDSNRVTLIAYPQPRSSIPTQHSVEVGQTITVDCPIAVGALRELYTFSWNKDQTQTLDTTGPGTQYRVDPLNQSLTIFNVQLDNNGTYYCDVSISVPGTTNRYSVPEEYTKISLFVTEKPTIEIPPRNMVVTINHGVQGSATFTCRARGTPTPTISWFLNERNITQLDDSRFEELSSNSQDTVTGQFTINELQASDSGTVKCVATVLYHTRSGVETFTNVSKATLSVLDESFEMNVAITTGGDVLFRLTTPAAIPVAVRLRIHFVAEDNPRNIQRQTSDGTFTNLTKLYYEVQNSRVPLQRFKVQLALMVENNVGPFVPADSDLEFATVYDLKDPTDDCYDYTTILIVCPIVGLIAVIVIVVAISCLIIIIRKMNQKAAEKHQKRADKLCEKAEKPGQDQEMKNYYLAQAVKNQQRAIDGDSEEEEATNLTTEGSDV